MNIEVTVFMPVYNCEKYLEEAIISILNQTFTNFELLIINDGSTDRSIDIINKFKDKRIRLFNNECNKGLPYTRNRGLSLARGKYIALMDADDISKLDRLEKQVNFLNKNKNIDVVSSNVDWLIDNKIIKSKRKFSNNRNGNIGLMFRNVIGNPAAMFRKDFIEKNNINYRKEYFVGQDYAFWIDCQKNGRLYIMPESLLIYRYGHNNITKKTMEKKAVERKKIIDKARINSLQNNGFKLKEEEYSIFNKIFSDPIVKTTVKDFKECIDVLNKIVYINNTQKLFNSKELSNFIKYELTSSLKVSKLKKINKFNIVSYKFKQESIFTYITSYIRILIC